MDLLQLPDELTKRISTIAKRAMVNVVWNDANRSVIFLQEALFKSNDDERIKILKDVFSVMVRRSWEPNCSCHISTEHFALTNTLLQESNWRCPDNESLMVLWQNIPNISNIKPETFEDEFYSNGILYIRGFDQLVEKYVSTTRQSFSLKQTVFVDGVYSNTKLYMP